MVMRIAVTHAERYAQALAIIRSIKRDLVGTDGTGGWYAQLAAGPRVWIEFRDYQERISTVVAQLDAIAAAPGFVDYVKSAAAENDPSYEIATEYQAMKTSLIAIRDALFNQIPKIDQSGTEYLLVQTPSLTGQLTERSFSSAATAPLRALINTFSQTVGPS